MSTPYSELERRFRRMANLGGAAAVLQWDWAAVMPAGGAEARTAQLTELDLVQHEYMADPELADLLDSAEAGRADLEPWQNSNLSEMRLRWSHANAVPADLVAALSNAAANCEMVWREARASSDFAAFCRAFEPLLELVRDKAAAKSAALGLAPYDALIDGYDPGFRTAEIDGIFADLSAFLPDFLAQVLEKQARDPAPLQPDGPFPVARQRALSETLMTQIGFDFDHGRLDESHHPFCGGVPEDVRITTRYDEGDFASSVMAVLHETGHALYERGLPEEWRGQPVGDARSMSLHESQSLLMEMQACRSAEFFRFAAPLMRDAFDHLGPEAAAAFAPENMHRMAVHVAPGFIRVDADEVTYPAHVILRYRLERAMIEGAMEIADLPGAWNEGMEKMLGLTPPNDREGCLQDLHWFDGAWGYFPTYTLGAMTAAQLFEAAKTDAPEIGPGIAKGDFKALFGWLKTTVHGQGSLLPAKDLLIQATGKPLDPAVFKSHLTSRYLA